MIYLILLCAILSGLMVWQRLEIIELQYKKNIIEDHVDRIIPKTNDFNILESLYEIKSTIYGKHVKSGKNDY